MNKFEAVILFSPDLSTPIIKKEEDNFDKIIETLKGKVHEKENWGLKDLSYSINNYKKAFYKYYQIEILGSELKSIKKKFNSKWKNFKTFIYKSWWTSKITYKNE